MKEFEITWLRAGNLEDLGLTGKPGKIAYVSEKEALSSSSFRRARAEGVIDARPHWRHSASRSVNIPKLPTHEQVPQKGSSMDREDLFVVISHALAPILETQKKMLMVLEELNDKEFSSVVSSSVEVKKSPRSRELEGPEIIPDVSFFEVKLEKEIQTATTEDHQVKDALGKLKQYRRNQKGND